MNFFKDFWLAFIGDEEAMLAAKKAKRTQNTQQAETMQAEPDDYECYEDGEFFCEADEFYND